jgi:hypothetical protein
LYSSTIVAGVLVFELLVDDLGIGLKSGRLGDVVIVDVDGILFKDFTFSSSSSLSSSSPLSTSKSLSFCCCCSSCIISSFEFRKKKFKIKI